jgi:hypothetical protein
MIAVVLTKYLPLGLRLLILWAGWMTFRFGIGSSLSVWESLNVTACLLMGLGIAGRLAALGLSGSTGYMLFTYGVTGKLVLLFSCSLILLQTGTGLFSVWQPEDTLFLRRGGEKK